MRALLSPKPYAARKGDAYLALPDKLLAETFERYLKTGFGRAFAERHFQS